MPRFFFDFHDNGLALTDEVGAEIGGEQEARTRARLTLRDAVADATQHRDMGSIAIVVRDDRRRAIIRAAAHWSVSAEDRA